jgi:hypothetical protein
MNIAYIVGITVGWRNDELEFCSELFNDTLSAASQLL